MKYITNATEERIMKAAHKDEDGYWEYDAAGMLARILDGIKGEYGWQGASVADAKKYGQRFDNACQLRGFSHIASTLNGWTVRFPELVNYTGTLGLDVLTIRDFNALAKVVLED